MEAVTAASDLSASESIRAQALRIAASDAFEQNGRSTKIHVLVEGKRRPVPFVLTGRHVHDHPGGPGRFLQAPMLAPAVAADRTSGRERARQQIFGPPASRSLR